MAGEKVRVACESCGQGYRIEAEKIPPAGRKVRCKTCGAVFRIERPRADSETGVHPGAEGTWKVRYENGQEEVSDLAGVKSGIRYGRILDDHQVLPPGGNHWMPAGEVPALQRYFELKRRGGGGAPPVPAASPAVAGPRAATLLVCRIHPDVQASHACSKCAAYYCEQCVPVKEIRGVRFAVCPSCGEPLEEVEHPRSLIPFWQDLGRILRFPFHPKGVVTFIIYAILSTFAYGVSLLPMGGRLGGLISVLLVGYLLNLIQESAKGAEHPPDFPEFHDIFGDLVVPAIKYWLATIVVFLPVAAAAIVIFILGLPPELLFLIVLLGVLFALLVYPMVLAILAVWGTLLPALNPALVLRLIGRIKHEYAIYLLFWYGAWALLGVFVMAAAMEPVLLLLVAALQAYLQFVLFHMLGRMCYQCEDKLAWDIKI